MGDTKLPIYIEGVNYVKKNFYVIDCLSCCNVIFGRPWIHDMKAIPLNISSTCQGPNSMRYDQQEAKNYYTSSKKPASKEQDIMEAREQYVKDIMLNSEDPESKIFIGSGS